MLLNGRQLPSSNVLSFFLKMPKTNTNKYFYKIFAFLARVILPKFVHVAASTGTDKPILLIQFFSTFSMVLALSQKIARPLKHLNCLWIICTAFNTTLQKFVKGVKSHLREGQLTSLKRLTSRLSNLVCKESIIVLIFCL